MWAAALGAEVSVISHTPGKKDDAMKLGATNFICSQDKDWNKPYAFTFDFILNCADATDKFDLSAYMGTMKVMGRFHNVGLPDQNLPQMSAQQFTPGGYYIGASHIGNRPEMIAMRRTRTSRAGSRPSILARKDVQRQCRESRTTTSGTASHSSTTTLCSASVLRVTWIV